MQEQEPIPFAAEKDFATELARLVQADKEHAEEVRSLGNGNIDEPELATRSLLTTRMNEGEGFARNTIRQIDALAEGLPEDLRPGSLLFRLLLPEFAERQRLAETPDQDQVTTPITCPSDMATLEEFGAALLIGVRSGNYPVTAIYGDTVVSITPEMQVRDVVDAYNEAYHQFHP